ncbi:hypothetical protein FOZ61_000805, partial [Perkinsus olseni]
MEICNDPDAFPLPTFQSSRFSSWIDVTGFRGCVPNNGSLRWSLHDETFDSDHRLLRLDLLTGHAEANYRLAHRLTDLKLVDELARGINPALPPEQISEELGKIVRVCTPTLPFKASPGWHWLDTKNAVRSRFTSRLKQERKKARQRFFGDLHDYCKCIRHGPSSTSHRKLAEATNAGLSDAQYLLNRLFPRDQHRERNLKRCHIKKQVDPIPPITPEELWYAANKLKSASAPGRDDITGAVLKHTLPTLQGIWLAKLNQILLTGHFPWLWKRGKGVFLPKAGRNLEDPSGWRPLVLTCSSSKLLENIISNRLRYHLQDRLGHQALHGYTCGRSVDSALFRVISAYRSGLKSGKKSRVALITLDQRNAFSCVFHKYIIDTLTKSSSPVPPYLITLIKSYLTGQTIDAKYGDSSGSILLERGVPQGSSLGPTLYLICTLELCEELSNIEGVTVSIFADDISVVITAPTAKALVRIWTKVEGTLKSWACKVGVEFSPQKCNAIIPRKLESPLIYDGIPLPRVKYTKLLGVTIDQRLSFVRHAKTICAEARRRLNILCRLGYERAGLRGKAILATYKTAILPLLWTGSAAWMTPTVCSTPTIQKLLCQVSGLAARLALRGPRTAANSLLTIMAGLIPPHIEVFWFAERRRAAFDSTCWAANILGHELPMGAYVERWTPNPAPPWSPPLSVIIKPRELAISEATSASNKSHSIFTDGSVLLGKSAGVGVAVCLSPDNWVKLHLKASDHCTIAEAELQGILEAVKWIHNTDGFAEGRRWAVYSDSQSALRVLQNWKSRQLHRTAAHIYDLLRDNIPQISLHWTPGHQGVLGNELADQCANLGRTKAQVDIVTDITKSTLKRYATNGIRANTMRWWSKEREALGSTAKEFCYSVCHAARYV